MERFHNQSFAARYGAMGDEAEAKFEEVHPSGFTRFGLSRPAVRVQDLPPMIRYTPDYLTSSNLVEVQGVGRDRLLKIKIEKAVALNMWHAIHPLLFFVWDSKKKQHHYLAWDSLWSVLHHQDIAHFPEGKPYWALHIDRHLENQVADA